MIAPDSLTTCCTSLLKHARAKPNHLRFHSDIVSNFLFDLATNLAILAALLIACHLCNLARPDFALNGGYTYLLLAATALVFDATLTFCVFADAPIRYGKFSAPALIRLLARSRSTARGACASAWKRPKPVTRW
jgi:hypothetical protein